MADAELTVAFVGAGTVNFGGAPEGPWDHASRLEQLDGVKFIGIADVFVDKAKSVLSKRLAGSFADKYKNCKVFDNVDDLLKLKPNAVFIGTFPGHRGNFTCPLELKCLEAGAHVFVEKPLSVTCYDEFVKYAEKAISVQKTKNLVFSVGYMFRYHAAVVKAKELIAAHGGKVMAVNLRYACAYSAIDRASWWIKAESGGPLVEQGTHFCDLARFIGGDVDMSTLQAIALKATDKGGAGELRNIPAGCEVNVPPKDKIPRITTASWHFENGGVGSIMHCASLHGKRFDAAIDIYMDGMRLRLSDPYTDDCTLAVRDSHSDDDKIFTFEKSCDPYREEVVAFVNAVRLGKPNHVASPYEDALKTYELTWKIRTLSEQ